MAYIKSGNRYIIRQTAKLVWPPNILVSYMVLQLASYLFTYAIIIIASLSMHCK